MRKALTLALLASLLVATEAQAHSVHKVTFKQAKRLNAGLDRLRFIEVKQEKALTHYAGAVKYLKKQQFQGWNAPETCFNWKWRLKGSHYAYCEHLALKGKATRALRKTRAAIEAASYINTGDFYTATFIAGRIFGYSAGAWTRRCAASEGSFGGFVMNRQGSGAGGWLQFMSSTFSLFAPPAFEAARNKGFRLASSSMQWTNPLGQAITGAYMYTQGLTSHWTGSTC